MAEPCDEFEIRNAAGDAVIIWTECPDDAKEQADGLHVN